MGRVARDEDGFTVYGAGSAPEPFRVWDDEHAGTRCTCERFAEAFASGDDYRCEHLMAVELWLSPPEDEVEIVLPEPRIAAVEKQLRRVV